MLIVQTNLDSFSKI